MAVLPPLGAYLAFIVAAGAIVLLPGPDTVTVLSQGATRGRRAGLATAIGVSAGVLVHTVAVALGLAAVLQASPSAYALLRLIGAAYLLYLGVQTLRAGVDEPTGYDAQATTGPFQAGFIVNATNPKVAIFFLAFLPTFTQQGPETGIQLVALGATYSVLSGLYLGAVGTAAGSAQALLETTRAQRGLRVVSGTALLALAAIVATGIEP